MARVVGVREARTHFSALINRAAKGEAVTITRRGQPVAVLGPAPVCMPVRHGGGKRNYADIVAAFAALRSRVKPDPTMTIRDMIEAGRRR